MIQDVLLSTMRLSVPLIFAAFGGMMSERSGVANVALESGLLFSAFAAAATASLTGNVWIGGFAGLASSGLVSAVFAFFCLWGRGDQIVIGTAINLLSFGLIPVLCKSLFGSTGSTPQLDFRSTFHLPEVFFGLAVVTLFVFEFFFRQSRHGLRILAAGENPDALITQGVDARRVRFRATIEGGIVTGIGGVYLSLCQGSGYIRDMSAGRGFIALAALIFGGWRPWPTFLACLFFALTDAVQIQLQGQSWAGFNLPNQFVQIIPYVATLAVLILYARKMRAPRAINQ